MGSARHPKPYKGGKAQVTVPWKRRVLAKIAANKLAKVRPTNIDQLGAMVGAKKGGINKLLDLEREPPQLTSAHALQISDELGVLPPVIEDDDDDLEFALDVLRLRSLTLESRRALMVTADRMPKKP